MKQRYFTTPCLFFIVLILLSFSATAQNVGVGTSTPNTKLDVNGSFATRQGAPLNLSSGDNNDIPVGNYSFYTITGPGSYFTITGFSGAHSGRMIFLQNNSNQQMDIKSLYGSAAANQIDTRMGDISDVKAAAFIYDSIAQKWTVLSATHNTTVTGTWWDINGNSGTADGSNFVGTIDDVPLSFRVNNTASGRIDDRTANTHFGYMAGQNNGGSNNTFLGYAAGMNDKDGHDNTAIGYNALTRNELGSQNTAVGVQALQDNVSGAYNTAIGYGALQSIGTDNNTAVGYNAALRLTDGGNNTFIGVSSAPDLSRGVENTFVGGFTGQGLSTGDYNTLLGTYSTIRDGVSYSTAIGAYAEVDIDHALVLGGVDGVNGFRGNVSVGIGTTAPTNALHVVAGSDPVRFEGLQPGSTSDDIVTVDGSGVLHYTPIASISGGSDWHITGNSDIVDGINFLGTTNSVPLTFRVNNIQAGRIDHFNGNTSFGYQSASAISGPAAGNTLVGHQAGMNAGAPSQLNTFFGYQAGMTMNTGYDNCFIGAGAGKNATSVIQSVYLGNSAGYSTTTGGNNLFVGYAAGYSNTTGSANHFVGNYAGYSTTTGIYNHFDGNYSGYSNSTGQQNVFIGYQSGYSNNTGSYNYFSGYQAGYSNTTSSSLHYEGYQAGYSNTSGGSNYGSGYQAGYSTNSGNNNHYSGYQAGYTNSSGSNNIGIGYQAGYTASTASNNYFVGYQAGYNTTAAQNHFEGYQAGYSNTGGSNNYASGYQAGYNFTTGTNNHASGYKAGYTITTGSNNTFVGYQADAGSNNLSNAAAIGYNAHVGASNTFIIGGTGNNAVKVGINDSLSNSRLQVSGSFALIVKNVTSSYTAGIDDAIITADASGLGSNLILSLPTASGIKGRQYTIKKTDSSVRQVVITASGAETIDGASTYALPSQWNFATVISDGTNWNLLAH